MVDLKKEQKATLERERCKYSLAAKIAFLSMDMMTGKKVTLSKAKLLETLASIPYREWEIRQYIRMTRKYKDGEFVKNATKIMDWGRHAQDNDIFDCACVCFRWAD